MRRYIDADKALRSAIEEKRFFIHFEDAFNEQFVVDTIYSDLADFLNSQPTADVVEVVRKPVLGYEGYYEVDPFGRVFGLDRVVTVTDGDRVYKKPIAGKQMKQNMHDKGYKTVSLTKDGKTRTHFVHRLVAEAFIPNPDNFPQVNHKDEDKTNNFLENLEWCTNEYNLTYGTARKRQARKVKGRPLSEEHKRKISDSMKRHKAKKEDDFCSYGERKVQE